MSNTDYTALEALAKAATPGPWTTVGMSYYHYQIHGKGADGHDSERICMTTNAVANDAPAERRRANADYIAAASPDVVLGLIEALRVAQAKLAQNTAYTLALQNDALVLQAELEAAQAEIAIWKERSGMWEATAGIAVAGNTLSKEIKALAAKYDSAGAAPQQKCSPALTECPRCKNDITKCDGLFAAQPVAQPVNQMLLEALKAIVSEVDGCMVSSEKQARKAIKQAEGPAE